MIGLEEGGDDGGWRDCRGGVGLYLEVPVGGVEGFELEDAGHDVDVGELGRGGELGGDVSAAGRFEKVDVGEVLDVGFGVFGRGIFADCTVDCSGGLRGVILGYGVA